MPAKEPLSARTKHFKHPIGQGGGADGETHLMPHESTKLHPRHEGF